MTVLFVIFLVCAVSELFRFRLLKSAIGDRRGLDFGFKYAAEIRKLREEKPKSSVAKEMKILDFASFAAWLLGILIMLLWKFRIVQ